jgi:hypothetical protein
VPARLVDGLRNAAEEPRAARPMFQKRRKVRIVARTNLMLDLLGRQSRVRGACARIGFRRLEDYAANGVN